MKYHKLLHINQYQALLVGLFTIIFVAFSIGCSFAAVAPNDPTTVTLPVVKWADKQLILVDNLKFIVSDKDNKVFENTQKYYPNGKNKQSKTCKSTLTFANDPYVNNGGQTAKLVLYELEQGVDTPTNCKKTIDSIEVSLYNAKAVNANQQNGYIDADPSQQSADPASAASSTDPICDPAKDSTCEDTAVNCADTNGDKTKCDIYAKYINPFISFLSIFAGIAFTIGLMIGGIRYITAGGDPGAVSKARSLIAKTIFALLAYILLWAFINWLQPGGIEQL